MKKVLCVVVGCVFLSGCGTTFQDRKEIYKEVYKDLKVIAPAVAKIYLKRQVDENRISQEEVNQIIEVIDNIGGKE